MISPMSFSSTPGIFFVPFSRGPTPDKKSRLPTLRAWGYSPTGSGALDELTSDISDTFGQNYKNIFTKPYASEFLSPAMHNLRQTDSHARAMDINCEFQRGHRIPAREGMI